MEEHAVTVTFGDTAEAEAVLVHWVYDRGAFVKAGDIIAEAMADKVSLGIEAPQDGYLVPLIPANGVFHSGDTVATIASVPPESSVKAQEPESSHSGADAKNEFVPAPPAVRRLAEELGVDLALLSQSVGGRRLTRQDVEDWAKSQSLRTEPFSPFRQALIRRLTDPEALPTTLHRRVHLGDAAFPPLARMAWAVAESLADHPKLHGWVTAEGFEPADTVTLGIAAETPQGLMVPTISGSFNLDGWVVALKSLAEAVKAGKMDALQWDRPSFALTNLGSWGIEYFTPRLMIPTVAILGIGRADDHSIPVSLTFDHRAVDGAEAAAFLATLDATLSSMTD